MERIVDTLIYNFQDRFKFLRDIQKRLQPATEVQDAVLAEEGYSSMMRARTDDSPGTPSLTYALTARYSTHHLQSFRTNLPSSLQWKWADKK